jgi:hypothetical protein
MTFRRAAKADYIEGVDTIPMMKVLKVLKETDVWLNLN